MKWEELDCALSTEEEIVPSAGFTDAVMEAVRREATTPPPISFPWKCVLPGLALAVFAALAGSPGGPTIISATMLTVLNWMRLGMDAQAAINAPRFHHQWMPDVLLMSAL